ncbi:RagB/SusD family nutrient uptake outer membrane protein [Aestuariibaculum sediminum]|uniref:RagB/SusD family nutrient uptake outer membrane protein n=1 Tax=Aestuariibaculum sediminum TaxID=2770637 RepID=A0A8J6U8K5_9FLAO|nr:RagB/SusD family nutrient uptake outer membrane protein [Aestuariibaculum sediminum]MBD0833385.1 RagB/SusD family nutrient uptake outer membrane protein [Aestuariibaculum sediminum]
MRNLTIYKYTACLTLAIMVNSCQLTEELDDYKPLYALEAETAINTQETAELALVGAYSAFRQGSQGGFPEMFLTPDILSGYSTAGASSASRPEEQGWVQNNPLATGASTTQSIYTALYDLVNRTNWLINAVDKLEPNVFEPSSRKSEILGEAKILRALGHFYLLRNFGQFYNVNSEYGINLRLEPVRSDEAFPRNTVQETYTSILEDLDVGIAEGPDLRTKKYTNSTFAKALKAKVLLYMGAYGQAANLAQDIIDGANTNFMLEPTYGAIFDDHDSPAIFQSSEILFGTAGEPAAGTGIGNFYSGFAITITQNYLDAISETFEVDGQMIDIDGENRGKAIIFDNVSFGGFYSTKYTTYFTSGDYEMIYHMRMAEVYLILAEASARANNMVTTEALNALNEIRLRAGATTTGGDGFETYPNTISLDQFLTAVRYEKLAEIYQEGGENWYDLIRYDYADGFGTGFQVSDVKPTATDSDKFILPIPTESIDAGGNVVDQNPGYN